MPRILFLFCSWLFLFLADRRITRSSLNFQVRSATRRAVSPRSALIIRSLACNLERYMFPLSAHVPCPRVHRLSVHRFLISRWTQWIYMFGRGGDDAAAHHLGAPRRAAGALPSLLLAVTGIRRFDRVFVRFDETKILVNGRSCRNRASFKFRAGNMRGPTCALTDSLLPRISSQIIYLRGTCEFICIWFK